MNNSLGKIRCLRIIQGHVDPVGAGASVAPVGSVITRILPINCHIREIIHIGVEIVGRGDRERQVRAGYRIGREWQQWSAADSLNEHRQGKSRRTDREDRHHCHRITAGVADRPTHVCGPLCRWIRLGSAVLADRVIAVGERQIGQRHLEHIKRNLRRVRIRAAPRRGIRGIRPRRVAHVKCRDSRAAVGWDWGERQRWTARFHYLHRSAPARLQSTSC